MPSMKIVKQKIFFYWFPSTNSNVRNSFCTENGKNYSLFSICNDLPWT